MFLNYLQWKLFTFDNVFNNKPYGNSMNRMRLCEFLQKKYNELRLESLGLWGDPTSPSYRRSVLGVHWKDWCWSWNSNSLATWCEELTHLKRPWCWERLRAGREGDDRGWDGWMASLTRWTWFWVDSGSWWWTGRPGVLQFTSWGHKELDTTEILNWRLYCSITRFKERKKERSLLWAEMCPPPSSYVEDLTPKVTVFVGRQLKLNEVTRVGP